MDPVMVCAPAECVSAIVSAYYDYAQEAQRQTTERARIQAQSDQEIARIQVWREFLLEYLDRSFDERRENFDRLFRTLDEAVDRGDVQIVSRTLENVVKLAESSPFKILTLQDARRVLTDPDAEIEL